MMEDNIPGFIGYHITKDGELKSETLWNKDFLLYYIT